MIKNKIKKITPFLLATLFFFNVQTSHAAITGSGTYEGKGWSIGGTINTGTNNGVISGSGLKAGLKTSSKYLDRSISHHNSLVDVIVGWTNFLLPFVSILAIIGLIVGGFFLITGYGNDSTYQKGRKIVLYSILGILIIYSAYPIINTIIGAQSGGYAGGGGSSGTEWGVDVGLNF